MVLASIIQLKKLNDKKLLNLCDEIFFVGVDREVDENEQEDRVLK
jgi:hypothetical protein